MYLLDRLKPLASLLDELYTATNEGSDRLIEAQKLDDDLAKTMLELEKKITACISFESIQVPSVGSIDIQKIEQESRKESKRTDFKSNSKTFFKLSKSPLVKSKATVLSPKLKHYLKKPRSSQGARKEVSHISNSPICSPSNLENSLKSEVKSVISVQDSLSSTRRELESIEAENSSKYRGVTSNDVNDDINTAKHTECDIVTEKEETKTNFSVIIAPNTKEIEEKIRTHHENEKLERQRTLAMMSLEDADDNIIPNYGTPLNRLSSLRSSKSNAEFPAIATDFSSNLAGKPEVPRLNASSIQRAKSIYNRRSTIAFAGDIPEELNKNSVKRSNSLSLSQGEDLWNTNGIPTTDDNACNLNPVSPRTSGKIQPQLSTIVDSPDISEASSDIDSEPEVITDSVKSKVSIPRLQLNTQVFEVPESFLSNNFNSEIVNKSVVINAFNRKKSQTASFAPKVSSAVLVRHEVSSRFRSRSAEKPREKPISKIENPKEKKKIPSLIDLENKRMDHLWRKAIHQERLAKRIEEHKATQVKLEAEAKRKRIEWEVALKKAEIRRSKLHEPIAVRLSSSMSSLGHMKIETGIKPIRAAGTAKLLIDGSFRVDENSDFDSNNSTDVEILDDIVEKQGIDVDIPNQKMHIASTKSRDFISLQTIRKSKFISKKFLQFLLLPGILDDFILFFQLSDLMKIARISLDLYRILYREYLKTFSQYFSCSKWIIGDYAISRLFASREFCLYEAGGVDVVSTALHGKGKENLNELFFSIIQRIFARFFCIYLENSLINLFREKRLKVIARKLQPRLQDFRVRCGNGGFGEPIDLYLVHDTARNLLLCFRVFIEANRLERSRSHLLTSEEMLRALTRCYSSDKVTTTSIMEYFIHYSMMFPVQAGNWLRLVNDEDSDASLCWITATEYFPAGSLRDIMIRRQHVPLNEQQIARICYFILVALNSLHEQHYVHRAVHSRNIYCSQEGVVKLGIWLVMFFFYTSEHFTNVFSFIDELFPSNIELLHGHVEYITPELLHQTENCISTAGDIYCLGHVIYEMATGRRFGDKMSNVRLVMFIGSNPSPQLPDSCSEELRSFLNLCLIKDPETRPTASTLLQHPFLNYRGSNSCLSELTANINNFDFETTGFCSVSEEKSFSWLEEFTVI